jgi:multicomponent Na+:H+ antiporter subunit A
MMLLGVGSGPAIVASLVYLVAHACYKGALFLVAGAVDHETGTRDVRALSGLRRLMPATATAGVLAAVSMAGVPPFLGFLAKEQLYAGVAGPGVPGIPSPLLLVVAVAASAMLGAAALVAGVSPFVGSGPRPEGAHEAPASLWLAPLVLAGVGIAPGLVALDLVGVLVAAFAVVSAASTGSSYFLDVAIVIALVSFVGTIAYARYVETAERS